MQNPITLDKRTSTVFLSYSTKDYFFAELLAKNLGEVGIRLWRDQDKLRAGSQWRQGIEQAISECLAVLVALSANSADSAYVTYEWAYALGKGKAVIPMKLNECQVHPKLETIQHLDFTIPTALPWASLIERIREIETDLEPNGKDDAVNAPAPTSSPSDAHAKAILAYLNQRGYQMASFERLRQRVDETLTTEKLNEIISNNPGLFRHATLAGGKPGIAKLIP